MLTSEDNLSHQHQSVHLLFSCIADVRLPPRPVLKLNRIC